MTKRVKLAMIRTNTSNPCPYGLKVGQACRTVGKHIENMAPLDIMGDESTKQEKAKIARSNNRALRWAMMSGDTEPSPCLYAGKLFPDKKKAVECNYDDTAPGENMGATLKGSPHYTHYSGGMGMEGLTTMPMGWYADNNISRNLFMGIYSLQGSREIDDLIRVANYILSQRVKEGNNKG